MPFAGKHVEEGEAPGSVPYIVRNVPKFMQDSTLVGLLVQLHAQAFVCLVLIKRPPGPSRSIVGGIQPQHPRQHPADRVESSRPIARAIRTEEKKKRKKVTALMGALREMSS